MDEEIKTLRIKVRGIDDVVRIREDVYPFSEMGIVYIRLITVSAHDEPMDFLIVCPEDIEYRVQPYTEGFMEEIRVASDAAIAQQGEYLRAAQAAAIVDEPATTLPSENDFV